MKLRLLDHIPFKLSEWTDTDFSVIRRNREEVSKLAASAGHSSDRFQESCDMLWRLAKSGQEQAISNEIKTTVEVRALSFLLSDSDFLEHCSVSKEHLDSLYKPSPKLGRLSLLQLIEAFFKQFDKLGDTEVIEYLASLIN